MSGRPVKQRFIVSGRLISPLSCCRDFNGKALRFKQSVNGMLSSARLEPEISIKALGDRILKKQSPDTDNKKREFTGDSVPGVEIDEFGHRWRPDAKWEPGSRLVISPPIASLRGIDNNPNFGWIPEEKQQSFEEMLQSILSRPHIKVSKYNVDPKTDDVDPSSEKIVDPFAMAAGLTMEERRKRLNVGKSFEKKSLGPTLGSRVPGGSLIARAAAAIGILRDANNKFRCPPGTPAANQYTDAMGSNCFGFSASRFARYAARQAAELTQSGEMSGFKNGAERFLDFVYNGKWFPSSVDPARMGRTPWYDAVTGERIDTPDWRDIDGPENLRPEFNGMINAQDEIARADNEVRELIESLGIDTSDAARAVNADVHEAFEKLKEMSDRGDRRGWDVSIVNAHDGVDKKMTPTQVEKFIKTRLQSVPGWSSLTKEEQETIIKADTARYYESERAFLESLLLQYSRNPSSAQFIGTIIYNNNSNHEAGTGAYREASKLVDILDPSTGKVKQVKVPGDLRGQIDINLDMIMSNQETMLPSMGANERLALAAVGGKSDSEAKLALSHFMLNADLAARHSAGLVDGAKSFTRHIALHEFSHILQIQAFIDEIDSRARAGTLEIPQFDRNGNFRGYKKVDSIYQLSGGDIMGIMQSTSDGINLEQLGKVMSRLEGVVQFAGAYPRDYETGSETWALEAAAELWALREQKLISGEDVDAVLEFMDNISASHAARSAAISEASASEILDIPDESMVPEEIPAETFEDLLEKIDIAKRRRIEEKKGLLEDFRAEYSGLTQEEMFQEAARTRTDISVAESEIERIAAIEIDDSLSDDEKFTAALEKDLLSELALEEYSYHKKKYEDQFKIWRSKYGLGERTEKARFEDEVNKYMRDGGLTDPEVAKKEARKSELDIIRKSTLKSSDKKVIQSLADRKLMMQHDASNPDEVIKHAEEFDVIKNTYIQKLKDAGDTRSKAKIGNEIDEKIEALLSPKPKPTKKFKSKQDADSFTKSRRAAQSRRMTPQQRNAVRQVGDVKDKDINKILDIQTQVAAGRAMNSRNARLARLGLEVDESSTTEAPLDKQVKNVLIPLMEAIDVSPSPETFEMEAVIEVREGEITGRSIGKDMSIGNFVTGKLMPRGKKSGKLTKAEESDAPPGKRKRRVIIKVKEGDRGIFSSPENGESSFIIPPGSLRVISRDEDGTLRLEISSQKDSIDVAESLRDSLLEGTNDPIWRKGAHTRVGKVVNDYVTERRESGVLSSGRNDSRKQISETNSSINSEIANVDATFGEGIDEPVRTLSSGSIFGQKQTRQERIAARKQTVSRNAREIKKILSGRGSKEFPEMSIDSIDPQVAELILNLPEEELISRLENAAYKFHSGLDRRVRVRMREEEVDEMSRTGVVRSPLARLSSGDSGISRRTERILKKNSDGNKNEGPSQEAANDLSGQPSTVLASRLSIDERAQRLRDSSSGRAGGNRERVGTLLSSGAQSTESKKVDSDRIVRKNNEIMQKISEQGGRIGNITPEYIEDNKELMKNTQLGSFVSTQQEDSERRIAKVRQSIELIKEAVSSRESSSPLDEQETIEAVEFTAKKAQSHISSSDSTAVLDDESRRSAVTALQMAIFGTTHQGNDIKYGVSPEVLEFLRNSTPEEIEAELEKAVKSFHDGLDDRVHVNMPVERISSMIEDGRYRTTHEVQSSHSGASTRQNYEVVIGIPRTVEPELRPASGYVVHNDWEALRTRRRENLIKGVELPENHDIKNVATSERILGQVDVYGPVVVRLKPEVSARSRYGWGDSFRNALSPAPMGDDATSEDLLNAIVSRRFLEGGQSSNSRGLLTMLDGHLSGDFSKMRRFRDEDVESRIVPTSISDDNYFEALVMGSFSVADIEEIELDYDTMPGLPKSIFPKSSYTKLISTTDEEFKEFSDSMMKTLNDLLSDESLKALGASPEEIEKIKEWINIYKLHLDEAPSFDMFGDTKSGQQLADARELTKQLQKYLTFLSQLELKEELAKTGGKLRLTSKYGLDKFDITHYPDDEQKIGDIMEIMRRRVLQKAIEDAKNALNKRKPVYEDILP